MDVTTTSPQTHNWELLAQLALCGQNSTSNLDLPTLVQQLVTLLQAYLPHPWGLLVGTGTNPARAQASWGLSSDVVHQLTQANGRFEAYQCSFYAIRASDMEFGHLLLPAMPGEETAGEQTFYQAVAAQIGLVLQAQQRDSQQRPLKPDIVGCINQIIASTTALDDLLAQSLPCLARFLPVDTATLALYQEDDSTIIWSFEAASGDHTISTSASRLAADSPLAQLRQTRQPLLLPASGHSSSMVAPLLTRDGQVSGCVTVQSNRPDCYEEDELALLCAFAESLSPGIEHALLVAQSYEQMLQLHILNQISTVAATAHEITDVYKAVVDALAQVSSVDQVRLMLRDYEAGVVRTVAEFVPTNLPHQETVALTNNPAQDWLDQHKAPLISYDAQNDPLFVLSHRLFRQQDVRSTALVPLMPGGEVMGCISLDVVGRPASFGRQQLAFCQTIANHLSTVIEKDRLFVKAQASAHALRAKVGELSTLLESAGILGSLLKPDEVLRSLTDLVSRQLRVTSVALWTLRDDNVLMPTALYGIEVDHSGIHEMRLPVGGGLTGTVAKTGLPLIVHDIDEYGGTYDPHFFGQDNRLNSFMGVPIFYRDRVIGVLSVMTAERREFSSDEMMVLVGLAGQAAVALENARLFQERERRISELTTINQISVSMNATLQLSELLLTLHHNISGILDTSYSLIGLYEETRIDTVESLVSLRVIRDGGTTRLSDQMVPIDGKGLMDYVVLTPAPLLLQSMDEIRAYLQQWRIYHDPQGVDTAELSALKLPFCCWLGVPIILGDDVLGIINVQSSEQYAYNADDMRFLSTVASQAAVAISNARLFAERERRLRELSVLKDIGSAISSTLDLQVVLENLRHELAQAIDVSTSMIGLYDEQTTSISYNICYNQGRQIHIAASKLLPSSNSANSWVIRNRQPLLLHTRDQGRKIGFHDFGFSVFDVRSGQSLMRLPQSQEVQSCLVVPIISGDSVLGVINLQSYEPYAFDQDDLRFVIAVANQAAVTIANVYLFVERGRRIEELATFNEIGRALSATINVEELLELVYRQTSRLLDTTNFYIALIDYEQGEISFPLLYDNGVLYEIPSARAKGSRFLGSYRFPRAPEEVRHWTMIARLTERVINLGEPLIIHGADVERSGWLTDIYELREELGWSNISTPHLWMGVPMMAADKVLGIIAVQNYERENAYGPDDMRVLTTIASSAAIALENARLFEQIRQLASDLECRVEERTAELAEANIQLLEEKERLEVVHAITLELTATLDLEEIIRRALEMSSINLGVARGSIMMRDPQSGALICRAVLEEQGCAQIVHVPISFSAGEGLVHWVLQRQEPVCIDDVRGDSRWVMESGRADEARSVVAVPLMTSDTTLGVLILSSPRLTYFTDAQLRLLSTIANEVAIAINNAQLYSYITEMATRLAELLEQQKEETSKSRSIFQSMTEGVLVLDTDERIAVLNLAAEHMLGIAARDVLDQPLQSLIILGQTGEQRNRARIIYDTLHTGLKTAKERQGIYSTSFELQHPTQTIAVNMSQVVGLDGGIYGDVAVLHDITPEIEADRAKREFFSKVSHELRTPLTPIKGYVDMLLLSKDNLDEQQISFLNIVKTNTNRLMYLINDILDLSRFEAGRIKLDFSQVDVRVVIQDVVQSLRLETEKKQMRVIVDIPDDLCSVTADQKRLTQVVLNLFSNAVKYTYEGGSIAVRAFLNPANLMQVEVEDTGVGMSPEQLQKLFRPFYRADNPLSAQAGGTGLGLSIARSLVEEHGGEMWVSSELGKGSTFGFVLPLEQPLDEPADDDVVDDRNNQ